MPIPMGRSHRRFCPARGDPKPAKANPEAPKAPKDVYAEIAQVDYVPPGAPELSGRGVMVIFEDNDAVIQNLIKGRAPNLRYILRAQRVDLDWLNERTRNDPGIHVKYINTNRQIADCLIKGQFTKEQWDELCRLSQTGKPHKSIDKMQ